MFQDEVHPDLNAFARFVCVARNISTILNATRVFVANANIRPSQTFRLATVLSKYSNRTCANELLLIPYVSGLAGGHF